jgi:hypothetical protein
MLPSLPSSRAAQTPGRREASSEVEGSAMSYGIAKNFPHVRILCPLSHHLVVSTHQVYLNFVGVLALTKQPCVCRVSAPCPMAKP